MLYTVRYSMGRDESLVVQLPTSLIYSGVIVHASPTTEYYSENQTLQSHLQWYALSNI